MDYRKAMQFCGIAFCLLIVVAEICAAPSYTPEDYEQAGIREMLEELERQGLTGAVVPRAYQYNPNHHMMRKSQRSNSLRLRFGKRSSSPDEPNAVWKTATDQGRAED